MQRIVLVAIVLYCFLQSNSVLGQQRRCARTVVRSGGMAAKNKPAANDEAVGRGFRTMPWFPKPNQIEGMIAECYVCMPGPEITPFVIPERYYEEILAIFRDATIDEAPSSSVSEIGTIRIKVAVFQSLRLCWFYDEDFSGAICFSCGGVRYRSSRRCPRSNGAIYVDSLIRKIHEDLAGSAVE